MGAGLVFDFGGWSSSGAMKVLDLQCGLQHSFEGWFASEADYVSQQSGGLLTCPLCGDANIQKKLSAPRLNLKSVRDNAASSEVDREPGSVAAQVEPATGSAVVVPSIDGDFQAHWLRAMREVLARTEDVGERFADQARAMHHGDIEQRQIRGQTTPEVAMELIEEGIDVMPLPVVPALKDTLQ